MSEAFGPPDETETVLLEAAYHTLCDHGYAGCSLRRVAETAGRSRGLVHYHYDSKDDLLVSLLDRLIAAFEARFDGPTDGSALHRLDALLDWVAFGPDIGERDGTDYFTAILELRAQAPYHERLRARLTRNYVTVRDRCADLLRDGIEAGELRAVDPGRTATFLVSAVDGARNADLTLDTDGELAATLAAVDTLVFEYLALD